MFDAEHFFDGYRANRDYALDVLRAAADAGADWLVLCDTNGGSLPTMVADPGRSSPTLSASSGAESASTRTTTASSRSPNSLAAVAGSAPGAGHDQRLRRAGRERQSLLDRPQPRAQARLEVEPPGRAPRALTELSRYVDEIANVSPDDPSRTSATAFAHKGGIHGDATSKVARAYEHVEPALVGNVSRLVVSELGGRANTQLRAEQLGHQLDGVDPRELSRLIKELEADGLAFEGAEASFELLIRRHQAGYVAPFRVLDFTVLVEQRGGRELQAVATVKVEVDGEVLHTAADGNGPVNALDAALRKAFRLFYPQLDAVHLIDFKVRIIDGASATAARTRVIIDFGRRDARMVDDGQRHEHHRGVGSRAHRLARVRDLEVGSRASTARRTGARPRRPAGVRG